MRQTLAGLTEDHERLVTCALNITNNHDLAIIYSMIFDIIDGATSLVLKEMFSTRSEIIYWEKLSKSSGWEIFLTQWNSKIFRAMTFQKGIPDTILENAEDMINHIESLRADFHELSILLAKLYDACGYLKAVFNVIQLSAPFSQKFRMKAKVPIISIDIHDSLLNEFNLEVDHSLKEVVLKDLEAATKSLLRAVREHLPPRYMAEMDQISLPTDTSLTIKDMNSCCSSLMSIVHKIIDEKSDETFPLDFSGDIVRRPSNIERFWVRNLLIALGSAYGCTVLVGMIQDGTLQELWNHLRELVTSKVTEHVVEPLTKLKQELFETIRSSDDHIVAKRDLELSKAALERMLTDFSKSKEGHALILPNIQEAKEEIMRSKERIFTKEGVADVVNAIKTPPKPDVPQVHTVESIRTGDALVDLSPTPEQALVALMNEYEKDLQHPIRGIMFGNLFTAILIQVQKLKVHTEAAMLKMDQILASNELTIAATAAMPAFGVVGILLYNIKSFFTPKAQSGGQDAAHFQLILADVERSLQEVHESIRTEERRVVAIKNEPVAVFPFSPSRRRIAEQEWLNGGKIVTTDFTDVEAPNSSPNKILLPDAVTILENQGASENPEASEKSIARVDRADRATYIAKGVYRFNLVRLRSKFHELFEVISPLSAAKVHTVSVYEIKWKCGNRDRSHSVVSKASNAVKSCVDFMKSVYTLLFGSNELMSLTTQYHSLNKDISFLESPDADISLSQKIETARRMRLSYKILSPVHF